MLHTNKDHTSRFTSYRFTECLGWTFEVFVPISFGAAELPVGAIGDPNHRAVGPPQTSSSICGGLGGPAHPLMAARHPRWARRPGPESAAVCQPQGSADAACEEEEEDPNHPW